MKKRVKLFATLASLCLAVALMAFGVYAAATQNFNVTASVKYEVGDDIAGTATVKSYQELVEAAVVGTAVETKTTSFTGDVVDGNVADVDMTTTLNTKSTAKYIAFTVEFAVQEGSPNTKVAITLTDTTTFADDAAFEYVSTTAGTEGTAAVIYYKYKNDGLKEVAATDISFKVTITNDMKRA